MRNFKLKKCAEGQFCSVVASQLGQINGFYGLDQTSVSELPKVIPASLHCRIGAKISDNISILATGCHRERLVATSDDTHRVETNYAPHRRRRPSPRARTHRRARPRVFPPPDPPRIEAAPGIAADTNFAEDDWDDDDM